MRSLVRTQSRTFSQGLADTLGTYASLLQWSGEEADAARIHRETNDVTQQVTAGSAEPALSRGL